jgi:hypothetical protein
MGGWAVPAAGLVLLIKKYSFDLCRESNYSHTPHFQSVYWMEYSGLSLNIWSEFYTRLWQTQRQDTSLLPNAAAHSLAIITIKYIGTPDHAHHRLQQWQITRHTPCPSSLTAMPNNAAHPMSIIVYSNAKWRGTPHAHQRLQQCQITRHTPCPSSHTAMPNNAAHTMSVIA